MNDTCRQCGLRAFENGLCVSCAAARWAQQLIGAPARRPRRKSGKARTSAA
ncbi:MAG: hypothetical protein ACK4N5_12915 [Myxococcales bacterium]